MTAREWADERGLELRPHESTRMEHYAASEVERVAGGLADAAEMLWVVLANVSEGNWSKQSAEWQDAAVRWRDHYFKALAAYNEARRKSI